jgi:hypothetical protein
LLYFEYGNADIIAEMMDDFKDTGVIRTSDKVHESITDVFDSYAVDDEGIKKEIKKIL